MSKKVTIYDIADKLNLSPSTVSRALADNSLINIRTRNKVKKAAEEMGYMENPLRMTEANTVAIIVPEIDNYFYSRIIKAIQQKLESTYLVTIMCSHNSVNTEKEIVSRLDPRHVKCLIISQSMDTEDSSHLEEAESRGIKIILFNRIYSNREYPKFFMDNYMDSYNLTNHLVSTGRRRIAFAVKHFNCPIYKNRIQGYKDVLKKYNITFNPDYLIYSDLEINDTHEVITRFLEKTPRPDALILPSFASALQAISIARLNNISIPKDLAIVSLDENPQCRYTTPSITSIDHPASDAGEEIAEVALQICNDNFTGRDYTRIFESKLIIRGSSFSV